MTAKEFEQDVAKNASRSPDQVALLGRFFKTGKGQYGEGDVFIGVKLGPLREVCKKYRDMPLGEIKKVLASPVHENRLGAAIIMAEQAKRGNDSLKKDLFDLYLQSTDRINNWDIVDSSCRFVIGAYLADKPRDILYKLARSGNLWERRIAIISTMWFIAHDQLNDTLKIAKILLNDKQDLIHKATGWMLREVGKRDQQALRDFLDQNATKMPRTMLRYSIEKFGPDEKEHYLRLG